MKRLRVRLRTWVRAALIWLLEEIAERCDRLVVRLAPDGYASYAGYKSPKYHAVDLVTLMMWMRGDTRLPWPKLRRYTEITPAGVRVMFTDN